MGREIEFVDGNTGAVIARTPIEKVPPRQRQVYLKGGRMVETEAEADETIPIVRVVKFAVDAEGRPAPDDQAVRMIVQEVDEKGIVRRETMMIRK